MMPTADSLGIEPMCRLAQVSRAGYYRFLQPRYPGEEEMEVRNAIQQIVLEHRGRYGYRRVSAELGRRKPFSLFEFPGQPQLVAPVSPA